MNADQLERYSGLAMQALIAKFEMDENDDRYTIEEHAADIRRHAFVIAKEMVRGLENEIGGDDYDD